MGNKGQALHEYAIALSLIALLSLGALKLLGWNIGNLLQRSTSAETVQKTDQLFSLVDVSVKSGGSGVQPLTAQASTPPASVSLKLDPATGQVVINSTSSGEKNSTSVDGGTVMSLAAQQLAQLANTKLANNQPLPDDIQALLKQLSLTGTNLSGYFSQLEAYQKQLGQFNQVIDQQNAQGQFSGPPYYDAKVVSQAIGYTNQYVQLSAVYQQLSAKLAALPPGDPAVAVLQQQVSDYTGAISSMAHDNVGGPLFSQIHIEHVNPGDLAAALQSSPATAPYFQSLSVQSANMTPAQRETFFQQSIVAMGEQMKVGTPISGDQGVQLALAGS